MLAALTVSMGKLTPWVFIALLPYVCWVLSISVDWGIIPLFIETFYFYPISWIGEPFFRSVEMGIVVPSHLGRFLGVALYSVVYWMCLLMFRSWLGRSGNS